MKEIKDTSITQKSIRYRISIGFRIIACIAALILIISFGWVGYSMILVNAPYYTLLTPIFFVCLAIFFIILMQKLAIVIYPNKILYNGVFYQRELMFSEIKECKSFSGGSVGGMGAVASLASYCRIIPKNKNLKGIFISSLIEHYLEIIKEINSRIK
jgi:hypothetical protein